MDGKENQLGSLLPHVSSLSFGAKLPFAYSCLTEVSFRWKNPDFLLKNSDFLLKHLDFITKQVKDAGSIGVLWETEMKGW